MHTPGPYEMPGTDGGEFVICTDKRIGKRRTIAHAYKREDAILLAAAPEMLAALHKAHDYLDSHGNGWEEVEALDAIRAAISMAGG